MEITVNIQEVKTGLGNQSVSVYLLCGLQSLANLKIVSAQHNSGNHSILQQYVGMYVAMCIIASDS